MTNQVQRSGGNGFSPAAALSSEDAFGYPRDFMENQFVYLVMSSRARGLSVGVNVNPVPRCNLNCLYCEVDRGLAPRAAALDSDRLAVELRETLDLAKGDWLRQLPRYAHLPGELLEVRHVALSGDGEPTLSEHFVEAVETVVGVRATRKFFKIVLLTNATALDQPQVQKGLRLLISQDEIWAKLDAGTQGYLKKISGSTVSLNKILANILRVARRRPVVIQSLFPAIDGEEPPEAEITAFAHRLRDLKRSGAQIPLVQIYSATRPMARQGCTHLPLKTLSHIAQTVRDVAGLRAEVY